MATSTNGNLKSFTKTFGGNNVNQDAKQGLTELNSKLTSFAGTSKSANAADIAQGSQSAVVKKSSSLFSDNEDQHVLASVAPVGKSIAQSSDILSSDILNDESFDVREAEINSLIEEFVMVPSSTAATVTPKIVVAPKVTAKVATKATETTAPANVILSKSAPEVTVAAKEFKVASMSAPEVTVAAKEFKTASISTPVVEAIDAVDTAAELSMSAIPTPPPAPMKGFNVPKAGPNYKIVSTGKTVVAKDTSRSKMNDELSKKIAARRAEAEKDAITSFGSKVEAKAPVVAAPAPKAMTLMTFDAEGRPLTPPPPPPAKLFVPKPLKIGTKDSTKSIPKVDFKDLADAVKAGTTGLKKAEIDTAAKFAVKGINPAAAALFGLRKTGAKLGADEFVAEDADPALAALSALKARTKTLSPEAEAKFEASKAKFEASKAASAVKLKDDLIKTELPSKFAALEAADKSTAVLPEKEVLASASSALVAQEIETAVKSPSVEEFVTSHAISTPTLANEIETAVKSPVVKEIAGSHALSTPTLANEIETAVKSPAVKEENMLLPHEHSNKVEIRIEGAALYIPKFIAPTPPPLPPKPEVDAAKSSEALPFSPLDLVSGMNKLTKAKAKEPVKIEQTDMEKQLANRREAVAGEEEEASSLAKEREELKALDKAAAAENNALAAKAKATAKAEAEEMANVIKAAKAAPTNGIETKEVKEAKLIGAAKSDMFKMIAEGTFNLKTLKKPTVDEIVEVKVQPTVSAFKTADSKFEAFFAHHNHTEGQNAADLKVKVAGDDSKVAGDDDKEWD